MQLVELRDSTGNVLAANGKGHVVIFGVDFKKVQEEGDLSNNKREDEWKGHFADSCDYICDFHKDILKSGKSITRSGKQYKFTKIFVNPVFTDGKNDFYYFIKRNLVYPESVKKRKISGSVLVGFDIESNGMVSNTRVINGLIKSLDDEAVRVVSMSPLWFPAYVFGIPIRTHNTVSVYFSIY